LREAGEFVTRIKFYSKSVAERQALGDAIEVGLVHNLRLAEAAAALGVFGLGQVAAAGWEADSFAGGGDFKPLGHGFFGLDTFWASHKSIYDEKERKLYRFALCGASVNILIIAARVEI
jgi:hypothetical protein